MFGTQRPQPPHAHGPGALIAIKYLLYLGPHLWRELRVTRNRTRKAGPLMPIPTYLKIRNITGVEHSTTEFLMQIGTIMVSESCSPLSICSSESAKMHSRRQAWGPRPRLCAMDKSLQPLGLEEVKTKQTLVLFSLFYFCRVEDTLSKPRVWPAIASLE